MRSAHAPLTRRALALLLAVAPAGADSLGEAAQRERERRARNREAGVEAPVVGSDELSAATAGRGTLSVGAGPPAVAPPASRGSKVLPNELDVKRTAARRRLDSQYKKMAPLVRGLVEQGREYESCVSLGRKASKCSAVFEKAVRSAALLTAAVERAESEARQGWLAPGDERAARERQEIDDGAWHEALRLAARYRR